MPPARRPRQSARRARARYSPRPPHFGLRSLPRRDSARARVATGRWCSNRSSRWRRAASRISARVPNPAWPPTVSAASSSLGLPYQQALSRSIGPLAEDADQERNECCNQKAVETVHQSSVTGDQAARILGAETPLDRGFEQVASLGKD